MPNMSNRLYQELHSKIFMYVHDIAWKEMELAGQEEKRLAIEKKCPASAKDMTPEEGINSKKIKSCKILDDKLHLKRTDNYYYQVQGQLHITRRMYSYFCIWTPKGFLFEIIKRDDSFWNEKMATQLTTFYMDFLLKQLIKDEY
ncbi:uncharacterized protein LOC132953789 [Metopolophium dirhodum]|uniref:uncharacterized protein LOC132946086 n=1 Tax=Metopolophium dirhodum TaxID=44670 RepID=UPI0029905563|nr:uncharacterized protein LOC132946086 [Metopolophium dirhodum]XP_060877751.1 uncharacterized protein LOC132950327 [Metopolophium dirhodum]XP_060882113.1 uncharacterized protein LOC132953789 [Metopolophium dirhodum]